MGREVVEKLTGKTVLDSMDGFFTRYGKHTIPGSVGYCLCPFRSNQLCCRSDFNPFSLVFIATGLGQLPATIVYSPAGSMLTGGTFWFVTGLFILFALTVVILWRRKYGLSARRGMPDGFTTA